MSNLGSFLLHSSQYRLNWSKYLLKHKAVMNKLLGSPSLASKSDYRLFGCLTQSYISPWDLATILFRCCHSILSHLRPRRHTSPTWWICVKTYLADSNISRLDDQEGLLVYYLNDSKSTLQLEGLSRAPSNSQFSMIYLSLFVSWI